MAGNPPAFPPAIAIAASGDVYHGYDGMSLRDYFAGQALPALLTLVSDNMENFPQFVAERTYQLADAMLAEREKEPKQ